MRSAERYRFFIQSMGEKSPIKPNKTILQYIVKLFIGKNWGFSSLLANLRPLLYLCVRCCLTYIFLTNLIFNVRWSCIYFSKNFFFIFGRFWPFFCQKVGSLESKYVFLCESFRHFGILRWSWIWSCSIQRSIFGVWCVVFGLWSPISC